MEQAPAGLIPPPAVVRERLARNYREADVLRRLLKLSLAAAERGVDLRPQSNADKQDSHA
jgi:hypothetical protein